MNDYYNDPPDEPEPPEWYMTLEDVLEMDPPESVAIVIRKCIEDWTEEYNRSQNYEPPDDPKELEGDYRRDCLIDERFESL